MIKRMMKYKKQRGQRRKINNLLLNIEQITPFTDTDNRYEHFHVPSDQFISSPKTSGKIKTAFCRAWLQKTAEIIEQKPKDIPFCKVVAVIDEDNLWESQIIIFYDKDYYNTFWERSSTEQKWLPIDSDTRSFAKERNIKTSLKEKGYIEILSDEDIQRKTVLWFYGDVREGRICDECGSEYLASKSKMASLCPECAHVLYGYENCDHAFKDGKCTLCLGDGSRSDYINKLLKNDKG